MYSLLPMRIYTALIFMILAGFFVSCGNSKKSGNMKYSLHVKYSSKNLQQNDSVRLSIKNPKNSEIDSVHYYYAENLLVKQKGAAPTLLSLDGPLGKHFVEARVFSKGKEYEVSKEVSLFSTVKPKVYSYKVTNTFPHDIKAFTQGLEFYKDTLYEGTGQYGLSSLRKIDFRTGEVLKEIKMDKQYFGEGITIMDDRIYQLTWREGKGFVYNSDNFELIKSFDYDQSEEGWGLCNDGEVLYKSDGTSKIWRLDPETLEEIDFIQPVTNASLANRVNEMEFINGKIYANTWQKEGVLIINPETGVVEALIDFRGLKEKLDNPEKADVLNGIAFREKTGKLYITGKNWDKLFEVELVEK